MTVYDSS